MRPGARNWLRAKKESRHPCPIRTGFDLSKEFLWSSTRNSKYRIRWNISGRKPGLSGLIREHSRMLQGDGKRESARLRSFSCCQPERDSIALQQPQTAFEIKLL